MEKCMPDIIPLVAKQSLDNLASIVRAEHAAVGHAAGDMLAHAIAAGDALLAAKVQVAHGEWRSWLRHHCCLSERTAQVYKRLAEGRAEIETNPQRAADLSIRAALRLIARPRSRSPSCRDEPENTEADSTAPTLDPAAWEAATAVEREKFFATIGLSAVLAAMPAEWRAEITRRVLHQHQLSDASHERARLH
jgi:hypothetical protein